MPTAVAVSPARQAVLDALSTVPGLTVTTTIPDTPTAGAAWTVWAESRYGPGKLCAPLTHTYEARVILPAGWQAETVDVLDGLLSQLCAALSTVGTFDSAQPTQIAFDNGTSMPGLRARVTVALY